MSEPGAEAPPGFWRRRLGDPLVSLLAQGLTPERLALSLAAGLVLGLFPIVGATTLLCLAAGCAEAQAMDAADLVVINTCAIREAAEAKVVGRQGHLGRRRIRAGR